MKLYTQDSNQTRTFVKEVFSFVSATNAVYENTYSGNWILVAGDKEFVFTAAVGDEWMEVVRDVLRAV